MGHYFGLPHTFSTSDGNELVDGSNCSTAGDGICDTPADPFVDGDDVSSYINGDDVFYYMGKDINGEYYSPLIGNYMSYYSGYRCEFTDGQYKKMVESYNNNKGTW